MKFTKFSNTISAIMVSGFAVVSFYATAGSSSSHSSSYYEKYDACQSSSQGDCNSALGESVYNLITDGIDPWKSASSSDIEIDGVSISMTAWSDTVGTYNDDIVTDAAIVDLGGYGYGVYNKDDEYYGSNPDHAIDSVNTLSHNVDYDFDYVMFSFSEEVTLTGAGFSWVGDDDNTQLSIAGLNDISGLISSEQTWANIVEGALTSGSYDINSYQSIDIAQFDETASAQYWLVGAYNSVFGQLDSTMFDDAFKLASIGFSKPGSSQTDPTSVSEPRTLGAFLACALVVAWRRKRK